MSRRVHSIDADVPFLDTLADALVSGAFWPDGPPPETQLPLARTRVFLPTRRAARALSLACLKAAGGPTVLPTIDALGDDEADGAIPPIAARIALSGIIARLSSAASIALPSTAPEALRLSADLLDLIDQAETEEADIAALETLVERAELAAHWTLTSAFLMAAIDEFHAHLAANKLKTPAAARAAAAERAIQNLATAPGPVIVAGSTGSIPATRRLMAAVADHPMGAIVLPGFDRLATPADWDALAVADDAPNHPQAGLKTLLDALNVAPAEVTPLGLKKPQSARGQFMAAAFRPAPATDAWAGDRATIDLEAAIAGLSLVEAADERAEAAAIALAMREAIDRGETTALVTPHRGLARRVSHALAAHGLAVDDSAGVSADQTPAGRFARLLASAATGTAGAAAWLSLLKHPLMAASDAIAVAAFEAKLRAPRRPPATLLPLLASLPEGARLAASLRAAFAPLADLPDRPLPAQTLAEAHARTLAALLTEGAAGPDIEAIVGALSGASAAPGLALRPAEWPGAFDTLCATITVRGHPAEGAVRILGPLEARLQAVDAVVLGGLSEGIWPAPADPGPFLSRGMMAAFGIGLPERKIGLSAHDMFVAAHMDSVTLTRARRAGGEAKLPSRWWQRLTTLAGPAITPAKARGARLLASAAARERVGTRPPPPRPNPAPPQNARPTAIRITDVGPLIRDPYAFYARRILALSALDPLESDAAFAERGTLIHEVMRHYLTHPKAPARAAYDAAVENALAGHDATPDLKILWHARLQAMAEAVVAAEEARRPTWRPGHIEHPIEATFAGVRLHGRVDRIDGNSEGAIDIIDYKTGTPPALKAIAALLDPQLPLEAAILSDEHTVAALTLVALGRPKAPVAWRSALPKDTPPADIAARAAEQFAALMEHYKRPTTGYLSRARVAFEGAAAGPYDHLARTAEWQV
ncbi:MAG: PD-(D/E)XK nuclease family protein [Pseudomonadota bacterium]